MDQIQIANWLLTRKCNLHCHYCAIVKNYKTKPPEYPDMKHYHQNEMSTDFILDGLDMLKIHNPNMFHIFYGGEPLLRKDLAEIVNFCNLNNIYYTIITNNSPEVEGALEELLCNVKYIQGLSSSVDPVIMNSESEPVEDRIRKSMRGLTQLAKYGDLIKDLVAEITVTNEDIQYLPSLVEELTKNKINSSVTFIDIAKSPYYDFSNITDTNLLVKPNENVRNILNQLKQDNLDVHMSSDLLDKTFDILPSELDCKLERDIHNITIDADGSIRLCLRIRGVATPSTIKLTRKLFTRDFKISPIAKKMIISDKEKYCRGCNHTCMLMSQSVSENKDRVNDLVHLDRR
jgi:MoaA/NifB/PqqE/SkfB family radical SAM enzyme